MNLGGVTVLDEGLLRRKYLSNSWEGEDDNLLHVTNTDSNFPGRTGSPKRTGSPRKGDSNAVVLANLNSPTSTTTKKSEFQSNQRTNLLNVTVNHVSSVPTDAQSCLLSVTASIFRITGATAHETDTLALCGLDSLNAIRLLTDLRATFPVLGTKLTSLMILKNPTVR